jgi:hypothetical protein
MAYPQRIVPDTNLTCLDYELIALSNVTSESCEVARNDIVERINAIDLLALCGCSGSPALELCFFCEGGSEIEAQQTVENESNGIDCAELSVVAPFVTDIDYCDNLQLFAGSCCAPPPIAETDAESCSFCDDESLVDPYFKIPGADGMTCEEAKQHAGNFSSTSGVCQNQFASLARGCCQSEDRCSICPQGTPMKFPNRPIMFGEGNVRCADLDFGLGFLSSDRCTAFHAATAPVEFGSWCGCEGAVAPDTCSLCGEDLILVNENAGFAGGVTCAIIEELARHVVDDSFCEMQVGMMRGECCAVPPMTESPAPLHPPFQGFPEASHAISTYPYSMIGALVGVVASMLMW